MNSQSLLNDKQLHRRERWTFLIFFTVLGGIIAGAFVVVYTAEYRESQSRLALEGTTDLEIQEETIALRVNDVATDVLFLTRTQSLADGLEHGDFSRASQLFRIFGESKQRYAQLRFLDPDGMEKVRVNVDQSGAHIVPAKDLQDKSERYYFRDSLNLQEGQFFVSPLDLNVEQGEIEKPENPMIRFSAPVFVDDDFRGLIVINYSAESLLEELRTQGARNPGEFYLLNSDGYYLMSPDRSREWGFMYSRKADFRFSLDHPDIWQSLLSSDRDILEADGGMITFRHIRPLSGLEQLNDDYHWIAVNLVSDRQLKEMIGPLRIRLFLLGSFLFILSSIPARVLSHFISRRARTRRELLLAARYDGLTGLPTRVLGADRLEQAITMCRRFSWKGFLLFLDLDGFKTVNDRYGHDVGDSLLNEVGHRLQQSLRESDTAVRYGGDEFYIIVPREDNDPDALAAKLIRIIGRPYVFSGTEVSIGVSIGIRLITGDKNETAESLLRDADTAMYRAKKDRTGHYLFNDSDLDQD